VSLLSVSQHTAYVGLVIVELHCNVTALFRPIAPLPGLCFVKVVDGVDDGRRAPTSREPRYRYATSQAGAPLRST